MTLHPICFRDPESLTDKLSNPAAFKKKQQAQAPLPSFQSRAAPSMPLRPSVLNQTRSDDAFFKSRAPPTPIPKPMNPPTFLPQVDLPAYNRFADRFEQLRVPSYGVEPPDYMTTEDAEKALRELIGGGMNQDLDDVDIDPSDRIVDGFKEGIELLPHQVLGRAWMRDRESGKLTGGILADDMGLGKTIQTLTRIVEGRAKKSDKAEGFSPSTL